VVRGKRAEVKMKMPESGNNKSSSIPPNRRVLKIPIERGNLKSQNLFERICYNFNGYWRGRKLGTTR